MSKRVLAIVLAALLAATVWSVAARADVEGSFNFVIDMRPQTTAGETSKMDFDVEAYLTLITTVSGLELGIDTTMGIAGPEYLIMSVSTTLGALDLMDEFVFAVPYYGVSSYYWDDWYFFDFMSPGRGMKGGTRGGPLLFVKKRVTSEITIGGLNVYSLFMLEDVNFPDPRTSSLVPEDLNGDGVYDSADQQWGLGAIARISGTTVSGIEVTNWTGFCADWGLYFYYPTHQMLKIFEWDYNLIKKKRWLSGTVEPDCYSWGDINYDNDGDGLIDEDPVDGVDNDGDGLVDEDPVDHKPVLGFSKEVIAIEGVPIVADIAMDLIGVFSTVPYKINTAYPWICPAGATWCWLKWGWRQANIPFFADAVFQLPVMPGLDFLAEFYTTSPLSFDFDASIFTMALGENITVHWYDNNGTLGYDCVTDPVTGGPVCDDAVVKAFFSVQDAVSLSAFLWLEPDPGFLGTGGGTQIFQLLTSIPISWPEPHGSLDLDFTWEGYLTDRAELAYWSIAYATEGPHTTFELKARYYVSATYAAYDWGMASEGLYDVSLNIGVNWSI